MDGVCVKSGYSGYTPGYNYLIAELVDGYTALFRCHCNGSGRPIMDCNISAAYGQNLIIERKLMKMKRPMRIKQIMPIPEGYGVLARVTDEDGKTVIEDLTKDGFCYVLALVAGGEHDDYVIPYEFNTLGFGELDEDAIFVQKHFCPKCGKEMEAHWDEKSCTCRYNCDCALDG